MATLNWIGKDAVVNHHRQVPYHLLRAEPSLSVGADGGVGSGNLLVQGDNLLALKALLPYYGGKVKCIYIDPPYNTGNEGWAYNDNVNSPEMKTWLGQTVGKEAEDLSRHDKWLCMMYPRLALLREFLSEDGAIFVSIDDAEVHNAIAVMNEVFGVQHHVGTVIWQHSVQPKGYTDNLSVHHNFILVYRRSDSFRLAGVPREAHHNVNYSNPDNDPRGPWRSGDVRNALYRPNLIYDLITPSGKKIKPPSKGWRWSRETMAAKIASGEVVFRNNETKIIRKIYLEGQGRRPAESIWFGEEVGTTRSAVAELKAIFDGSSPFDTPKPVPLMERVIQVAAADKNALIMDSFAGSGTTGHAVLAANRADGGNRRFILVQMEENGKNISKDITAVRLARVIKGYHPGGDKKQEKVPGLGGGFRYVTLGPTLFDEHGRFRSGEDKVTFAQLAAHIFFTQTGEPIPKPVNGKRSPLIGTFRGTGYFLLFNGVLGDRRPGGGNVLTRETLAMLPAHDGPKVVFGEGCRLSPQTLNARGITFRQIPYQVSVS